MRERDIEKGLQKLELEKELEDMEDLVFDLIRGNQIKELKNLYAEGGCVAHVIKDMGLIHCCIEGTSECLEWFLENVEVIQWASPPQEALDVSICHGRLDLVKYLIARQKSKGEDLSDYYDKAFTSVSWAYDSGHPDIVDYLISLKPNMYWMTHDDKLTRIAFKDFQKRQERLNGQD